MLIVSEFKGFVLRGNVVDLAVGVVIGAAFGDVVNALVSDIITPHQYAVKFSDYRSGRVFWDRIAVEYALAKSRLEEHVRLKRDCPYCLSSIPRKAPVRVLLGRSSPGGSGWASQVGSACRSEALLRLL